jgi:hypothetical protein
MQVLALATVLAQIRSKGASPDDIAFAPVFNAALIAQGYAAIIMRAVKVGRYYDPQWVAAQAWPRPLPENLISFELFQHFLDGMGGTEMTGRGYDFVSTLHVPNSLALGLGHLRTAQNREFARFADRFDLKVQPLKIDQGGEALHKGGLMEVTFTTPFNPGPPITGAAKAMCFSEHESSETDGMVAVFIGSRLQAVLTPDQNSVYELRAPAVAITLPMALAAVSRAHFQCTRRRLQDIPLEENASDLLLKGSEP